MKVVVEIVDRDSVAIPITPSRGNSFLLFSDARHMEAGLALTAKRLEWNLYRVIAKV